MINVSTEYLEAINAPMRKPMKFVAGVGVANTEMTNNSEYFDNSHIRYSNVNGLKNLNVSNKIYTTSEANMYILDGEHEITPEHDNFQGYVSSSVSGVDSTFAVPPKITIQSDSSYDLIGFTIVFDEENNDYATDFKITYYDIDGDVIREHDVTDNLETKYIDDTETVSVNKIEVEFYKTHNYSRRMRVTRIVLGIYEEFYSRGEDNAIISLSHNMEISPISKEIPMNDFSFTINDETGNYNAENPTGIWKYTKQGQIVTLKYIQTLEDGGEESVAGGRFYLEDRPTTEEMNVSFKGVSRIESLDQTYDEGVYYQIGRSYKALLEDVFTFCGLKPAEYEIDSSLASMITTIPLPKDSAKNCIQLICQATGTIAYEDTSGKIFIKYNNNVIDEYMLALNQNYTFPKYSEETPELRNIIMTKHTPTVSNYTTELANASFVINGDTDITIEYGTSTNHTYTITGATVEDGTFYANCCKLSLSASGTSNVTITVSGNAINTTATNIIYKIGQTGYDCELEFQLLSEDSVATHLAAIYAKYLSENKRYEIDYRGNPEIRPNDIIQIATRFTEEINAMILASKFNWNNGAKGSLTLKNYLE